MLYILIPSTKERRERRQKLLDSIYAQKTTHPFVVCIYESEGEGWAIGLKKMIEGINDTVWLLSDDWVLEENCIEELMNHYNEKFPFKDGMVQPNGHMEGGMGWCPVVPSNVLPSILDGYIHYADYEIQDYFKKVGRWSIARKAKVNHEHYSFNKDLEDETYRRHKENSTDHDMNIYQARRSKYHDI